MDSKTQYQSLYDYLGRPAGSELGKQVAKAAAEDEVVILDIDVATPNYKGKILTYPTEWLNKYFGNKNNNDIKSLMVR